MNQAQQVANLFNASFADQSLALVCAQSPVVKRTLDNYGKASLADYLHQTLLISKNPLQSRNDLLEVVYRYAAPLLGEKVAEKASQELDAFPIALTANHHGVDFLAQSVQGSLIFSLRQICGKQSETVPIFACGNIALNNSTYPRGLLLYTADRQASDIKLPIRLPIFSDRHKRKSVSTMDAFDSEMLAKAQRRLSMYVQNEQLTSTLAATAAAILSEDYQDKTVIGLKNYSQQAVVLNNRIWKRCFREPERVPELVYLELEKITSLLLQIDLRDEDSLIWQVMFNPILRGKVLSRLDGAKTCWDRSKLSKRMCLKIGNKCHLPGASGTIFFWAIDDAGCRVPLLLIDDSYRMAVLQGRDEQGKLWTIPFTPRNVLDGLRAGRLLPSLFTCYSTIGFARGISCCGGYFQAEYLPVMQHGLVSALHELGDCKQVVEHISQVPSDIYLSGMQMVMHYSNDNLLLPAGPIEMIANGGLTPKQIEQIRLLTVWDTHLAGLMETISDLQPVEQFDESHPVNWRLILAKESVHLLNNCIILT